MNVSCKVRQIAIAIDVECIPMPYALREVCHARRKYVRDIGSRSENQLFLMVKVLGLS